MKSLYKDNLFSLYIDEARGTLYDSDKLLFRGNSKTALKLFINRCKDGDLKNKLIQRYNTYENYRPVKTSIEELKDQVKENMEYNKIKIKRNKKI